MPTKAHRFIEKLSNSNKLRRIYSQNIDRIECKLNIPDDKLILAHGSIENVHCTSNVCSNLINWKCFEEQVKESSKVVKCQCGNLVHPGIVLYGEDLPISFYQNYVEDLKYCDLLIVIGSSLKVPPLSELHLKLRSDIPIIVLDHELPKTLQKNKNVFHLKGDIEESIDEIQILVVFNPIFPLTSHILLIQII